MVILSSKSTRTMSISPSVPPIFFIILCTMANGTGILRPHIRRLVSIAENVLPYPEDKVPRTVDQGETSFFTSIRIELYCYIVRTICLNQLWLGKVVSR